MYLAYNSSIATINNSNNIIIIYNNNVLKFYYTFFGIRVKIVEALFSFWEPEIFDTVVLSLISITVSIVAIKLIYCFSVLKRNIGIIA